MAGAAGVAQPGTLLIRTASFQSRPQWRWSAKLLAVAVAVLAFWNAARAEAKGPKPAAPALAQAPQPAPPVAPEQILYLVRSTLISLNDANRSGNYSVFRDLAAPSFQARYTAADLAIIFTDLRRRNFDLFAVAVLTPQLTAVPTVNADVLRFTGSFATRPLLINFDLGFEAVGGKWLLAGIAVTTPEAPALAATPALSPGSAPAKSK